MQISELETDLPSFTSTDIIKVMAATYLPLCEQLARAGALDKARLGKMIAGCAPSGASGPWVDMLGALRVVLERPTEAEIPHMRAPGTRPPGWRIIEGVAAADAAGDA